MNRRLLIAAVAASGSVALIATVETSAGPFDALLSGPALQAQREHDFLFSSLRYLADEARDDEAEQARVMGILTSGGFSPEQLANAVHYIAKPPADASSVGRDTLAARARVVRRLLARVRAVDPPLRYDEVTIVRVQETGLYIEIGGRTYSGKEAEEMYPEVSRRMRLTHRWDELEAWAQALEQLVRDDPGDAHGAVAAFKHKGSGDSLVTPSDAARDFADNLVSRLVRDLETERKIGGRAPSMDRFRHQLVHSSGVVKSSTMLVHFQMSGKLISQMTQSSSIQESAMGIVIDFGAYRLADLRRELRDLEIPDGPEHPDEFQPRPQAGGAIGGSFTDFLNDQERIEYEENYQRMKQRNEFKAFGFALERELQTAEQDFVRLIRLVDSMCDSGGKAMLRELLRQASDPQADYLALSGLPPVEP